MFALGGPVYVLVWATAAQGLQSRYYADDDEGRATLRKALGELASPLVYFVRVYREDTAAIVAGLAPGVPVEAAPAACPAC